MKNRAGKEKKASGTLPKRPSASASDAKKAVRRTVKEKSAVRAVSGAEGKILYTLVRKDIKNMYLRIRDDGEVFVTANRRLPDAVIDSFVKKNERMIRKAWKRCTERMSRASAAAEYHTGDRVRILGKDVPIVVSAGKKSRCEISETSVLITVPDPSDTEEKERVYKKALLRYTKTLFGKICLDTYAEFSRYGFPFPSVTLRPMKSRWGSCRPQRNAITLNTRMIEAPRAAIEYVVVHEFSHFLYADHSKNFYAVVEKHMPDWKERKKGLAGVDLS